MDLKSGSLTKFIFWESSDLSDSKSYVLNLFAIQLSAKGLLPAISRNNYNIFRGEMH
jgi:hypothetical protein